MPLWRSPHDSHSSHHLGKKTALLGAIALSVLAFVLQVAGAWYTGSLALLGDSAHLMTDLFSLVMALAAVILAGRPATRGRSFGLYRLEVLASFVNGLLLLAVAVSLAYEGVLRIWHPEPVKATELIWVASIGLLFNLGAAALLYRASKEEGGDDHHHDDGHSHGHHQDRNLQSALLHVWSDALGSVAVIAGAVVMAFTSFWWVDAFVGLILALWIFRWAFGVILDSGHVLLESTPRHVEAERLLSQLRALDERVVGVDDLHVWELTSRMYAATAEVRVRDMNLEQAEALRQKMHLLMHDQFGIAHVVVAIRPV